MLFLEEKAPSVRLACMAVTLVAGETLGFALHRFDAIWAGAAFAGLTLFLLAYGWGASRLLFPVLFVSGAVLALRTESQLKDVLERNAGIYGAPPALDLPVEGNVCRRKSEKNKGWHVDFQSHAGPVPLKVILPVKSESEIPRVGETWRAEGRISQKQDIPNRYSQRKLWVFKPESVRRLTETKFDSGRAAWESLGEELSRRAGEGLSWCPELAGLNRAILLGRRSELSRERKRMFADAGTIHVFAISGLHVMVVAWLLCTMLKRVGMSAWACGLISLPLVWAYVVLTGSRPSAVRAAAMTSLMLIAPILGRRPDPLAAWSVTVMGVYGISPERIYDLGCALSFTVMFGIVFWCHWSQHFRPWFAEGSWKRNLCGSLGVSFAAWVAGVPLAAAAFGRFTPGGLLANLAVIVCAKQMVRFGASALVVSFVCMPLGALLNNVAAFWTWGMTAVSESVAALPYSSFEITPWPVWFCVLWYLGWFSILCVLGAVLPRREITSKCWW